MDTSVALVLLSSCCVAAVTGAMADSGATMRVRGESLVLAARKPGRLCFDQVVNGSLVVRSTFSARKTPSSTYEEGHDYVVDYARGTIARTAHSRIPDFTTSATYGMKDFDHTKVPSVSNHGFFVWADYRTTNGRPWARPNDQSLHLRGVRAKLEAGGPFKLVSYGDSIAAGGEASEVRYRFQQRFARYLRIRFRGAQVKAVDASISGYASQQGVDWFDQYLGPVEAPDLVLVGFGMNDHNIGTAEPDTFRRNLITIVQMVRERKGADALLFSAFPPNDNWHYGTHRMAQFAAATREAAAEAQCAYVDVFSTWEMVLRRKDQPSLLGNNINHPNDFGHWLYEQAFEAIGL